RRAGTAPRRRGPVARAGRSTRGDARSHRRPTRRGYGQAAAPAEAGRECAPLSVRLARRRYEKLDDVVASVDRYAEVLEGTPGQPQAVADLEAVAGTGAKRDRIAVTLEPVYRQSGDLNKLVGALEAQLDSVDDRADKVR